MNTVRRSLWSGAVAGALLFCFAFRRADRPPTPPLHRNTKTEAPPESSTHAREYRRADEVSPFAPGRSTLANFEEWKESPRALEIAHDLARTADEEIRRGLAERVLAGELDAPLPELKGFYLEALDHSDPDRRMRAISRLPAEERTVADRLVLVATRDPHPLVRYEALKALEYAGRPGLLSAEARERIRHEYEPFAQARE